MPLLRRRCSGQHEIDKRLVEESRLAGWRDLDHGKTRGRRESETVALIVVADQDDLSEMAPGTVYVGRRCRSAEQLQGLEFSPADFGKKQKIVLWDPGVLAPNDLARAR